MSPGAIDLLGLSPREITDRLPSLLDRPFRGQQIFDGIYRQGATTFAQMTNLSQPLRQALGEACVIGIPRQTDSAAAKDGTRKGRFEGADGAAC